MKIYRKAAYLNSLMSVYMVKNWYFDDCNLYTVWEKMNPVDRKMFNFSITDFDWQDYFYYYVRSIQHYLLKEPNDYEYILKSRHHRKR